MKFFHISDLHLGKTIYGRSMLEDQRYWIDRVLELCDQRKPDAVLISGDVYDRAAPGGDAVELLDRFVSRLADRRIPVLMIAGNHDSGQRLSFGRTMLAHQNVHIAGNIDMRDGSISRVILEDPEGAGPVTFWLLPYIYPELVSLALKGAGSNPEKAESNPEKAGSNPEKAASGPEKSGPEPERKKDPQSTGTDGEMTAPDPQDSGEEAQLRTYDEALRALLDAQDMDPDSRHVILSHQNVTAGGVEVERGGSETMVGGVGQIDFTAYDAFDYAALGHIHSSYPVGRPQVRYAGTPICYHFAETRQENKGLLEVRLGPKGETPQVKTLPVRPLHKMRFLEGTREDIYRILEEDPGRGEYLGVRITDERITPQTASYLRQLLEGRGSFLLELLSSHTVFHQGSGSPAESVEEQAVEDLFADFYRDQSGGVPPEDEEYEMMQYVGELVRRTDPHQPLREEDVDRILAHAAKLGGEGA